MKSSVGLLFQLEEFGWQGSSHVLKNGFVFYVNVDVGEAEPEVTDCQIVRWTHGSTGPARALDDATYTGLLVF